MRADLEIRLRKWVRMALRYDGWNVNMVGTRQDGDDMTDKVRFPA